MPTPTSTAELLDLVRRSGVLSDDVISRLESGPPLPETPGKLAAVLVKQGLITQFQAKLFLAGKHRGFKLGAYIVKDQLGVGGMGAVYLAEHETLKRKVALKVLTADDPLAIKRFAREARSAAALDHPNIVRLFDVAKHGEVQYLVMEYVDGQNLDTMMTKVGRLPFQQVADMACQVALGLQHAYEKGFVHRDIKPANLMVTKSGQMKILDMGLARSGDAGDKLTEMMDKGAVVGTADYISPEQAIYGSCDIRADIYALGATCYHLVAGHPPFQGTTTQKLVAHQMKEATPLDQVVEGVPPEFAAVVARMMGKQPDDRYQTPEEVATEMAQWAPLTGTNSTVDISGPAPSKPGASTKRLNKSSAKTDVTPISAMQRRTTSQPVVASDPQGYSEFDLVEPTTRSGTVPAPSSRIRKHKSGRHRRKERGNSRSPVGMFVLAGVCGFIIVGVAVFVGMFLTKPKNGFEPLPVETLPRPAQPAPTSSVSNTGGMGAATGMNAAYSSARNRQWSEAANQARAAVQSGDYDSLDWMFAVSVQAQAGDIGGYTTLSKNMRSRFGNASLPEDLERTAKVCLLLPSDPMEVNTIAAIAGKADQITPGSNGVRGYVDFALALAEYRQGKYAASTERLRPILNSGSWNLNCVARVVFAMAQSKTGDVAKSREVLQAAVVDFNKANPSGIPQIGAHDWLIFHILYREAEGLLGAPPVRPIA